MPRKPIAEENVPYDCFNCCCIPTGWHYCIWTTIFNNEQNDMK